MLIGSIEWFKAKADNKKEYRSYMENLRYKFLERFSPTRLKEMDGKELLDRVFEKTEDSMMHLLMFDPEYRRFGASSEFFYMSIIYKGADGIWVLYEDNTHTKLSQAEAEEKAVWVRDMLINCCNLIETSSLETVDDYKKLKKELKKICKYYSYTTVLKYFQMVYPYYFPTMYSDDTLIRCISILGLQLAGRSTLKRIENAGLISLFIRNCNINNIVWGSIYEDEWGWDDTKEACPAASYNKSIISCTSEIEKSYYSLDSKIDLVDVAVQIEADVNKSGIEGKEKEAIVKIRVNQSEFRSELLKRYNKCCLCGVSNDDLLIASHIKPWSVSEPKERLDIDNGFILCPSHDKLFDKGYISFDDEGDILISDRLNETDRIFMNINERMKVAVTSDNKKYLKYHRENVFN